jgi:hypothetical protein
MGWYGIPVPEPHRSDWNLSDPIKRRPILCPVHFRRMIIKV